MYTHAQIIKRDNLDWGNAETVTTEGAGVVRGAGFESALS